MTPKERVVVDTNALISRLLLPDSVPGRAVCRVVDDAQILVSEPVMEELADVLGRAKFDSYVLLGHVAEMVPIVYTVRECRDPRDDKFLELAVNGEADLMVTGDDDLLVLNPFRGIPIVTPAAYLAR